MAQIKLTKEQEDERVERGKQLSWNALEKLGKLPPYPYGEADEDLMNEVYEIIWNDSDLHAECLEVAAYHTGEKLGGLKSLSPSITLFVKDITKGKAITYTYGENSYNRRGRCTGNGLAQTYQKLRW